MGVLWTKTVWVGLAAICTAVGMAIGGEMTWPEAITQIVAGVLAITFRHAIRKGR